MADPYRPPQSDIEIPEPPTKTGWKVFFWVLLVMEALSLGTMMVDSEQPLFEILIELLVYPLILAGLFGYAFNRRILVRRLWIGLIPIALCYDFYWIFESDWGLESSADPWLELGLALSLVVPLLVFQYLGLVNYAFRSPDIWHSNREI